MSHLCHCEVTLIISNTQYNLITTFTYDHMDNFCPCFVNLITIKKIDFTYIVNTKAS